jgi:hypothetical protein
MDGNKENVALVLPMNSESATEVVQDSDEITLISLDSDTLFECMSIPTNSSNEYRMVTYIMLWARRNGIDYEFDEYGNIYLTKGKLDEGEYYPCVTSHMDTVHDSHGPYIKAGVPLELVVEYDEKSENHILKVNEKGIGIGADDKGGICICLSMFKYHDKLKACFFLEEEVGCVGSKKLWKEWFNDVGYVIGYDSPELHRAAWSCSGTKLFSFEFYQKYMKEVCDRWGLVEGCFFSEPYTDVKQIREQTEVMCMNFGNGGYNPHSTTEYCVIEDMDKALGMGIELIRYIGNTRHTLKHVKANSSVSIPYRKDNGFYGTRVIEDDTKDLENLGDNKKSYVYGKSYTNCSSYKGESNIRFEVVDYITRRYEKHISQIKQELIDEMEELCASHGIKDEEFKNVIESAFNNQITF